MKIFLFTIAILFQGIAFASDEVVFAFDFTGQPDGNAIPWLKQKGFEFKLNFDRLNPRFENGALWLSTQHREVGTFSRNSSTSPLPEFRRSAFR